MAMKPAIIIKMPYFLFGKTSANGKKAAAREITYSEFQVNE